MDERSRCCIKPLLYLHALTLLAEIPAAVIGINFAYSDSNIAYAGSDAGTDVDHCASCLPADRAAAGGSAGDSAEATQSSSDHDRAALPAACRRAPSPLAVRAAAAPRPGDHLRARLCCQLPRTRRRSATRHWTRTPSRPHEARSRRLLHEARSRRLLGSLGSRAPAGVPAMRPQPPRVSLRGGARRRRGSRARRGLERRSRPLPPAAAHRRTLEH